MSKLMNIIFLGLVLFITGSLAANPSACLDTAKGALDLCLTTLIPALFPFFVCSGLLSALGFPQLCSRFLSPLMRPLFNLPGAGAVAFVLGILSGYPIGADTAAALYSNGQCTKTEAERMLSFCNNSGPLFVMGVVGSRYLQSPALGRLLYLVHILSALLVGVIFRFYGRGSLPSKALPSGGCFHKKTALLSLGGVVDSSVSSMLKVCGIVIFFAVVCATLPSSPFLYGFFEVTGGLRLLSQCTSPHTLPLMSFFLSLSGLSVMLQVHSIISPKGLSIAPYIFGKLLQGTISFCLTAFFLRLFPLAKSTLSAPEQIFSIALTPSSLALGSTILALSGVFLLSLPIVLRSQKTNTNRL